MHTAGLYLFLQILIAKYNKYQILESYFMSLVTYNKKRDFKKTAEPAGRAAAKKKNQLIFVVQQHDASHLHYDFRLEMEGVLKSWAVPKGPSMNPDDKRLAMMVEDHPYDYKDFEGTIPEGNYGAGNVIVWDNGTYHSLDAEDKTGSEKQLLAGLKKGHISFILHGKKLKGEFSLIRLKGEKGNEWLLIKKKDEFSGDEDILKKNKSVITSKALTLRERKTTSGKRAVKKKPEEEVNAGIKAKQRRIGAMKATLTDEIFDDKDWIFEIKHDGYRALALIDGKGSVDFYSRNMISFNKPFASIVSSLEKITQQVTLDGEVVIDDDSGKSNFQLLQNYQKSGEGNLKYIVFDLLYLQGNDLTLLPLTERKKLLKELLDSYSFDNIFYSDHIEGDGKAFFEEAKKINLEGIIGKKKDSHYRPDTRSKEWLKFKIVKQQETVIAGFTAPQGGRKYFGSLILGVNDESGFSYCGNCGTGFTEENLKSLYLKFKPLFSSESPFTKKIKIPGKVQWLKPKLVCEVKFSEWTSDGSMRHPVFLGLRIDKSPAKVVREITSKEKKAMSNKTSQGKKTKEIPDPGNTKYGNQNLSITNREKIYWPDEKITKGDLIDYYSQVGKFMLPYLKDRPQSMHRFPNGIKGESFYQKDVDVNKIPSWLTTEKIYSESNKAYINYLVCNDIETLIYMANLGCIEINPWNSRIASPENPDWLVIDLDPEDISFKEVVIAANAVRKVFEELDVESYCKTSGATGLHIYIPLAAKYDYDIVKTFAELIATNVHDLVPDTTSLLRSPAKRKNKVYVDFLQNRRGQTLAAPYSVRPKPGATVSTPLEWTEVNARLDPKNFTIKNIFRRLDKTGDLWKPVIGKGVDIKKCLKKLQEKE
jgi:bifunctional non-homologous end joining protein LigD